MSDVPNSAVILSINAINGTHALFRNRVCLRVHQAVVSKPLKIKLYETKRPASFPPGVPTALFRVQSDTFNRRLRAGSIHPEIQMDDIPWRPIVVGDVKLCEDIINFRELPDRFSELGIKLEYPNFTKSKDVRQDTCMVSFRSKPI